MPIRVEGDSGGVNRDSSGVNRDSGGTNRDSGGVNRDSGGVNRTPEERIIPTNGPHAEHRDFGAYSSQFTFYMVAHLMFLQVSQSDWTNGP